MVKKKSFHGLVISIMLLSSILLSSVIMINVSKADEKGPRSDLRISFYGNVSDAYAALKNGDVDFLDWPLNQTYLQDAEDDSNLSVAGGIDNVMYEFDINNNYSIPDYPGVKSPTHETKFRQAIAHAIDKDHIVNSYWSNLAVRIDQPFLAVWASWMNETYLDDGYPYEYNLTRAAQLLDELGFVDTDENGWRNYPSDWPDIPEADFTEYPLKTCVRTDHAPRLEAGRYLVSQLEDLGIKCDKIEANSSILYAVVMENRSYHIYTGGWSIGLSSLYGLFHGSNWYPWGSNYVTGMNHSNQPNYPELDCLLEDLYYADSFEEAEAASKKALGFIVEKSINMPLVSPMVYSAYRKEVHNVATTTLSSWNSEPINVLNKYTLLSAYKDDQTPIRIGCPSPPSGFNVLYPDWRYSDNDVLGVIYDELTYFQPYDPTVSQPWLAHSWEMSTWYDMEAGENKSKFTFHLRNDSYWVKPVTGDLIGQFVAEDYEFSIWYLYQTPSSEYQWQYNDVHHVKVVDNYTIEVYMDVFSIWAFKYMGYPILPMEVWTDFTQLAELETTTFIEGINATTPGHLNLPYRDIGAPLTIDLVKANETELAKYVDYNIQMGKLKILSDLPNGTIITVTFWARGDPGGFYPGDLSWQDILVGNGPFYITELVPEVGGHAYLKANPHYFLSPTLFNRDLAILDVTPSKTSLKYGETVSIEVQTENQGNMTETFYVDLYVNTTLVGTKTVYNLLPNASETLTFEWNTTGFQLGIYTVQAVAETLLDETDISDNTYINGIVTLGTSSQTYVCFMPSSIKVTLGVTFAVEVNAVNVSDLYGFEIELSYNTTVLNAINASEGFFLKQAGDTMIFANETNDAEGYVWFAVSLCSVENGVSGNGTLFTVFFNSSLSAMGTSSLAFDIVELSDRQSQRIDHYDLDGTVDVVEVDTRTFSAVKDETTYEITTVSNSTIQELEYKESESKISLNSTGPTGHSSFCNVTIPKDLLTGSFAVLLNGEPIYYEQVENGTHYILCFSFSHSTVEIDILLTLRGDINGDRKVDLFDAVMVLVAYGSKPGSPNWDPRVDLIKDNKINIYDAVTVCVQYGKTWQP